MTEKVNDLLVFSIPLAPFPMPRPRRTKSGVFYTPKEAKTRTAELQMHLIRLTAGQPLLTGPIAVEIGLLRAKKRDRRRDGDGDNYEKWILDACTGTLWADDRQVVDCHWWIDEADEGRVELTVGEPT